MKLLEKIKRFIGIYPDDWVCLHKETATWTHEAEDFYFRGERFTHKGGVSKVHYYIMYSESRKVCKIHTIGPKPLEHPFYVYVKDKLTRLNNELRKIGKISKDNLLRLNNINHEKITE